MSIVNTIIDLVFNSIPTWNLLLIESKQMIKNLNEIAASEVKKAEETMDYGDISMDLYTDIVLIADGDRKTEELLMAKAIATERWIKYTYYCLTDKDAVKIVADNEAQELVNGIVELLVPEIGKLYEDAKCANLHKYNASELKCGYNGNFILNIDDITKRFTTDLVEKAKEKFNISVEPDAELVFPLVDPAQPVIPRMGRYDNDGYFHPVFLKDKDQIIQENNSVPVKPDFMPDELFTRFDSLLKPLIDGKYFYNMSQYGNWCVNVVAPDGLSVCSYVIDDGTIMGGSKVSILGRCQGNNGYLDTLFVDVAKFPNIVHQILNNSFYIMTPDEVSQVFSGLFSNGCIYHNIDFKNTPFMDEEPIMRAIEPVLSVCIKLVNPDVRMRFENFIDPNNFTLVSDDKCVSPLGYDKTTATEIQPDLKMIIEGNTITKIEGGKGTKYQF